MSSKRPHELSARKRTALILEDPSAVAFPGPEHAMGFAGPGDAAWPSRSRATGGGMVHGADGGAVRTRSASMPR